MNSLVFGFTSYFPCILADASGWFLRPGLLRLEIVILGCLLTLCSSGSVVRHFIGRSKPSNPDESVDVGNESGYDVGALIGKCENILAITLVLSGAYTALGLLFTAKTIVRAENMKVHPKYYLGGSLVNITYSVLAGSAIRLCLNALG